MPPEFVAFLGRLRRDARPAGRAGDSIFIYQVPAS